MTGNRKLAPTEQSMEIINRCAGSFNIVTISRIQGGLKEEIVRQALDLIQTRHSRLNSCIVGSLNSLRFVFGAIKIPLRVVFKESIEQWQEVVLEELNQPICSDKCLIRTVLITFPNNQLNYLLITLHHAISDGISSVQLHSEILAYCQKIVERKIENNICSLHPLPDIQELMPKSMQGKIALIKSILFLLRFQLKLSLHRSKYLKFEKYVPIELRRCNMIQRKFNKEITTKLVARCRKENTTVHGALCAAMMLAVARKIRSKNDEVLPIICNSPVDLRKHFQPEVAKENLGMLFSAITTLHKLDININLWNLARDVREQIKINLENENIFHIVLMSKKIYKTFLSHPNKAPVTMNVSNIGRIDIPSNYGLFQLEEISFVFTQAAFGGVFGAAITTFQDMMILNFMFSEPSISKETIESLVNDTIFCIVDACNKENMLDFREAS